ncbi:hypothetical protein D9M72_633340 [compost metagenome]
MSRFINMSGGVVSVPMAMLMPRSLTERKELSVLPPRADTIGQCTMLTPLSA